ncbi:MAG: hypothetical protein MZV70_22040 [Desulfobacterales bacterium]|nr:hypothetical protein [Desulfobacterales bacterium]
MGTTPEERLQPVDPRSRDGQPGLRHRQLRRRLHREHPAHHARVRRRDSGRARSGPPWSASTWATSTPATSSSRRACWRPPYHYGLVLNVPGAVPYSAWTSLESLVRRPCRRGPTSPLMGIGRKASLPAQLRGRSPRAGGSGWASRTTSTTPRASWPKSNAQFVARAARLAREAGLALRRRPADVRNAFQTQHLDLAFTTEITEVHGERC